MTHSELQTCEDQTHSQIYLTHIAPDALGARPNHCCTLLSVLYHFLFFYPLKYFLGEVIGRGSNRKMYAGQHICYSCSLCFLMKRERRPSTSNAFVWISLYWEGQNKDISDGAGKDYGSKAKLIHLWYSCAPITWPSPHTDTHTQTRDTAHPLSQQLPQIFSLMHTNTHKAWLTFCFVCAFPPHVWWAKGERQHRWSYLPTRVRVISSGVLSDHYWMDIKGLENRPV